MLSTRTSSRSNQAIFLHRDNGSPHQGLMEHISGLSRITRLDFERYAVAGDVIFAVEGDATPDSQQDEEARIGTTVYARKKLGDAENAAEFMRCLNAICAGGDARSRQSVASHYFNEIANRNVGDVLKEMGLLAMQLAGLNPMEETIEIEGPYILDETEPASPRRECSDLDDIQLFFHQEVASIKRMTSGRRKSSCFVHDDADWVNDLEAGGASIKELDDAFAYLEAMDQYDEGGAILLMSTHERTVACGRIDPEFTADDLPERAQFLAAELRRAYAAGGRMDEVWDDINAQIDVLFPTSARLENGARFYSQANRELQRLIRQILEAMLDECRQDFHLTALHSNKTYRQFHKTIRGASDARAVGQAMKQAFEARQTGAVSLKHFIALRTAAALQRERLQSARLSLAASNLIKEINQASTARLRYLSWAFYGTNQPEHLIHSLKSQEIARIWYALKERKSFLLTSVSRLGKRGGQ